MANKQAISVALVAAASWGLAKLGYSLMGPQKQSTITVYVHEIRAPPHHTWAASSPGVNDMMKAGFGTILVFDNEIRDGPERSSALIGRERGYGPVSDLHGIQQGVQIQSTLVFGKGSDYKGTITLLGIVGGPEPTKELAIVGGTGDFRGAKGHALVETVKSDAAGAVFQWNLYVSY